MKNTKTILIVLLILITTISFAQKYNYVPKEHSNKWKDGKELCINSKNGITVKMFVEKENSKYLTIRLFVENNSLEDINIFPENIYYKAKAIDLSAINFSKTEIEFYNNNEKDLLTGRLSILYSNQYAISNNVILRNSRLISFIGYVSDIKSSSVEIPKRFDKFKTTLLFKNTVEPTKELERIAVFNSSPSAGELEFHLIIEGEEFVFNFEKEFINK